MSLTLKDVAEKAGVTVTTVSRVLNNRGPISQETREKVYNAMNELRYYPNEAARSLSKNRTNVIGVILPSVQNPFFSEMLGYLERYAFQSNYKIQLCVSNHEQEKEQEYVEMMRANKVAGIIISSRTLGLEKYFTERFPVVSIERLINAATSSVTCNNYEGGRLATQHLIERGCKKLAHIGGVNGLNMIADERSHAFKDVCDLKQIPYEIFMTEEAQFHSMEYIDWLDTIVTSHPEIDGYFTSNDIIAIQLIHVCHRHKLHIPDDIKIVGFDDILMAAWSTPALTTIRQPIEQMSKAAIDIIRQYDRKPSIPTQSVLGVTLVQRETT